MNITKISVVSRSGYNDIITLTTDLPSPYKCDEGTDTKLFISFNCARGNGVAYVKKHFNFEPEIIQVS